MASLITLRPSKLNDRHFVNKLTRKVMMPYITQIWKNADDIEAYFSLNCFDLATTQIIQFNLHDVGRLSVTRADYAIKLDNIHLLATHQGKGIGRFLMQQLIEEAERFNRPLLLNVLQCNPALKLCQSLGFEIIGEDNHRYAMRKLPPQLKQIS